MIAAPTVQKQLHHLTVLSDLYAETPGGNVYAIRPDRFHTWTLASRTDAFDARTGRSVEECDAWLTVWLATR
jgi:hypothetical protein